MKFLRVSHQLFLTISSHQLYHAKILLPPKVHFALLDSTENDKNAGMASPRSTSSRKSQALIIDENSYHKENLDYLFGILNSKDEINCVLIGYFAKVVSSFFQKNKKEICSYFFSNESHLHTFLNHLYSKSLVDPLKNFLVMMPEEHFSQHEDSETRNVSKGNSFSRFYKQRVDSFNQLYTLVGSSDDSDVIHNAQYILETLIAKVDQTVDGSKLLDDVVLRKENIQTLFNCLKSVKDLLPRTTSTGGKLLLISFTSSSACL